MNNTPSHVHNFFDLEQSLSVDRRPNPKKSYKVTAYFCIASLTVLMTVSFFVFSIPSVQAQEDEIIPLSQGTEAQLENSQTTELSSEEIVVNGNEINTTLLENTPDEVIADTTVTADDLQVKADPVILPDSPLYGVKNLFRGVRKAFTFAPEKKAQLEIRYASERVIEAEKVLENAEEDGDAEKIAQAHEEVVETLDEYQEDLASAIGRIEGIKENANATGDTKEHKKVDILLENLTGKILLQSKKIEKLEEKIEDSGGNNEEQLIKLNDHREEGLKKLGTVLTTLEDDPEKVAQRFDRVVEDLPGSKFKQIRAMEVLQIVEDKMDNNTAKSAIVAAREKMITRFEERIKEIPEEGRFEKFDQYMRHSRGNEIRQMQVVDEIKLKAELPDEVFKKMELMKEKMAEKFKKHFEEIRSERIKDQFMRPLQEGDAFDNLRIAADLKGRMPPEIQEVIAEQEKASVQKFKEAFSGDDNAQIIADKAERLMEQMRSNPTPAAFRALDELHSQLTPEQQKFVDQMQQAGATEMSLQMQQRGEEFFQRIATSNPGDIELFEELAKLGPPPPGFGPDFGPPPGFAPFDGPPEFDPNFNPFEMAREFQFGFVADHMQQIDDPNVFKRFEERFDSRPDLRRDFDQHRFDGTPGGFDEIFRQQEVKIEDIQEDIQIEFKARIEAARSQFGGDFDPQDFQSQIKLLEENKSRMEQEFRNRFERREFPGPPPGGFQPPGDFGPPPGFPPGPSWPGQGEGNFPPSFDETGRPSGFVPRKTEAECSQGLDPVCGRDGVTYKNRCLAEFVGIASEGPCSSDKALFDRQRSTEGLNFENGILTERQKPETPIDEGPQVSEFEKNLEGIGRCNKEINEPVCGSDGKTYFNQCFLQVAGVRLLHSGSCRPDEVKKAEEQQREDQPPEDIPPQLIEDIRKELDNLPKLPDGSMLPGTQNQPSSDFGPPSSNTGIPPSNIQPDFNQPPFNSGEAGQLPPDFQQPPPDFGPPSSNFPSSDFGPPPGRFQPPGDFGPPPGGTVFGASTQIPYSNRLPAPIPDIRSRTFPIDLITGFIRLITFAY